MTLPERDLPRKARRRGLAIPWTLFVVLVVAWSAGWFWLRDQTEQRMDAAVTAMRAQGYEVSWRERTFAGFPFRMDVNVEQPRIREPSGWAISAPILRTEAFVYALGHWIVVAPKGVTLHRPIGGDVIIHGEALRASFAGFDQRPPRISVEGANLTFTPGPSAKPYPLAATEKLALHLRPGPDDQGALMLRVDGAQARLEGLLARVAENGRVSLVLDTRLSSISRFAGRDWPSAVRSWTAGGGFLTVQEAGIVAGEAVLSAKGGSLTVGPDGRLRGALRVELRQAPEAFRRMGESGALPMDTALAAAAVAAAVQGAGPAAQATVSFENGQTVFGPVAVGPAPRVY